MLRKEQFAERYSLLCKDDESARRGFLFEALVQIHSLPFLNMILLLSVFGNWFSGVSGPVGHPFIIGSEQDACPQVSIYQVQG